MLSNYQKEIINNMKTKNLVLVTNEGHKYKTWLETKDREFIRNVDVRTAVILSKKGYIKPIDTTDDNRYLNNEFPWILK